MNTRVNSLETTQGASTWNLEIKMGRLAQDINQRSKGIFPSNTKIIPKKEGK